MAGETREAEVKANITALETKWGPDNFRRMIVEILKDISITLAKLYDK